jgi:SAM-dependent methyltransferase/uncharacterized protein YbaR (Trm112 family)
MLKSTIPFLACPGRKKCKGLQLKSGEGASEVEYGILECVSCHAEYPILAGVAVLVQDVHGYLMYHVKGISKFVTDAKIPKEYRRDFVEAKKQIHEDLIEEDLESDRVNALYLMNHYLNAKGVGALPDPQIDHLVKTYWDKGPLAVVTSLIKEKDLSVAELGCGVGGLYSRISANVRTYVGVDTSFQSILLARHFNLSTPYSGDLKIPADLLKGPVSREVKFESAKSSKSSHVDFVVGEIDLLPLKTAAWDLSVSMNTIDMLEDPRMLPNAQHALLKKGGSAIQSDPYIWHDQVAKRLRSHLPKTMTDSAGAVEHLYQKAGFEIVKSIDHVPWIFFKHLRQVELYSVHVFLAH